MENFVKKIPFDLSKIDEITKKHPTPFHIYDEKGIIDNANKLKEAFSWNEGFKQYFAVKATPTPEILRILKNVGFGMDCSSEGELILSENEGIVGESIMFTSNDTPIYEFKKAKDLGAIINLDDISHLSFLDEGIGLPELLSFRFNPGPARTGNVIIGDPKEAKYGLTKEQLFDAYKAAKEKGAERFGLHTMVASNELDYKFFVETSRMLFELVSEITKECGVKIEFVNLGGGIGIPYKPEEEAVDYKKMSEGVKELYDSMIVKENLAPLKIYLECGRVITGPYGYLVSKVLHKKDIYKKYVGLDSSMANLMRPGMYGAYHHVSVLGKENDELTHTYDVTGSLCENNDKFAIDRKLPEVDIGDTVVIHDSGAHGHSMGFNYNAKLRSAELLLKENGEVKEIRRAETYDDLFATIKGF